MACIKTGAHVYLHCYDEWLLGDVFRLDRIYFMRVSACSPIPIRPVKHFVIYNFEYWWDKHSDVSTLVSHEVEDLGYEGVTI